MKAEHLFAPPPAALRQRLLQRVEAAVAAGRPFFNVRGAQPPAVAAISQQWLYRARSSTLRPGEPRSARLIELRPGARLELPEIGDSRAWLLLDGQVEVAGQRMGPRDYLVNSGRAVALQAHTGARIYLREAPATSVTPRLQADAAEHWHDFAPGIRRRVMWQCGGQAAMLYETQPGAQVPLHGHGHDEECLMLAGELFLDDLLLRAGEYQLAPAGTQHREVSTDTGAVLFAHGDLELQLLAA